ncbi:MAG: hypothetical protein WCK16_03655 [Candidatus Moraniibacteriota bacterium]
MSSLNSKLENRIEKKIDKRTLLNIIKRTILVTYFNVVYEYNSCEFDFLRDENIDETVLTLVMREIAEEFFREERFVHAFKAAKFIGYKEILSLIPAEDIDGEN